MEKDDTFDEEVTLTLMEKDILLLKLCVLMACEYNKGGTFYLDAEHLLRRLSDRRS